MIRQFASLRTHAPTTVDPSAVATIQRALGAGPLVVEGPSSIGKTSAIVAALGRSTIVVDLRRAVAIHGALSRMRREVVLRDAALVLRAGDWDPTWPAALRRRVIELVQAGAILSVRDGTEPGRLLHGAHRVRIGLPPVTLQQRIWNTALGCDLATFDLCVRYPLPPGEILRAVAEAREAVSHRGLEIADLVRCARERSVARQATPASSPPTVPAERRATTPTWGWYGGCSTGCR